MVPARSCGCTSTRGSSQARLAHLQRSFCTFSISASEVAVRVLRQPDARHGRVSHLYGMQCGAMGGCYVKVAVESVHCGARGGPIWPLVAALISKLVGNVYRLIPGRSSGKTCVGASVDARDSIAELGRPSVCAGAGKRVGDKRKLLNT